jgi:hypothetical protein
MERPQAGQTLRTLLSMERPQAGQTLRTLLSMERPQTSSRCYGTKGSGGAPAGSEQELPANGG